MVRNYYHEQDRKNWLSVTNKSTIDGIVKNCDCPAATVDHCRGVLLARDIKRRLCFTVKKVLGYSWQACVFGGVCGDVCSMCIGGMYVCMTCMSPPPSVPPPVKKYLNHVNEKQLLVKHPLVAASMQNPLNERTNSCYKSQNIFSLWYKKYNLLKEVSQFG